MSTLNPDLFLLEARGLIRLTYEQGKPIIRFKHALTRDATYSTILIARRGEIHRAVARTLELLYPQRDLEQTLNLAEHWQQGGEDARTLATILPRASDFLYTGRSASLAAVLTRLERQNLDAAQQRDLDILLGDIYSARGDRELARELYERALDAADTPALRARLLHSLGVVNYHLGAYDLALVYHQASLELAEQLNDVARQAQAAGGLGLAYSSLGNLAQAESLLLQSRALSVQLGESLELANAEYNLAGVLMERGKYADAIAAAERALALDEKLGHPSLAARSLQLLGAAHFGLGDVTTAEEYYLRAIQISRELDDTLGIALGLGNLAELYAERGQAKRAAERYGEALELLRPLKYGSFLAFVLAGLAYAELIQARAETNVQQRQQLLASARHRAEEAREYGRQIRSPEREGVAERVLAEIAAVQGDSARACQHARRAIELLEQGGTALELRRTFAVCGRILAGSADSNDKALGARLLGRTEPVGAPQV